MGEVYRASDSRLHREVALNHPNIAAIYGLEDSPTVVINWIAGLKR